MRISSELNGAQLLNGLLMWEEANVDNEEIETPFAIIEVRSANCTNKQREVIQR